MPLICKLKFKLEVIGFQNFPGTEREVGKFDSENKKSLGKNFPQMRPPNAVELATVNQLDEPWHILNAERVAPAEL